jgi:hypothetical protein
MTGDQVIRYSYATAPTIKRFSESDAFVRGIMGPFGSGKSSGCVIELIKRAAAQRPGPDGIRKTRWVVVRNTFGQLADTTQKTFLDWIPPHSFGTWKPSEHHYLIDQIPGCEIEVLFRALDRPDHVRNLLSLEVTGAWVNEAREIPWAIIEALQGRVGRYPSARDGGATWHGIIMDTNPPDADSRWYQYFEELRPDNAAIFKQPSGLSPHAENLENLPDGYYENLALGKDPEWIKVYIHGQYGFVVDGRPVYPEYNDATHCREIQPIPGRPVYRGWDFGLTPAAVLCQLTPKGQLLILDEVAADNMGIDRFGDQVLGHCGREWSGFAFEDIGDPAGESASQTDEKTCFQILHGKGIKIVASPTQDPTKRIESVKKPLNTMVDGQPGLLVHPRCKFIRKGFQGGYQYRRMHTSAEKYADKPDKNMYSHRHDALQYVAVKLFGAALTTSGTAKKIKYRELYR